MVLGFRESWRSSLRATAVTSSSRRLLGEVEEDVLEARGIRTGAEAATPASASAFAIRSRASSAPTPGRTRAWIPAPKTVDLRNTSTSANTSRASLGVSVRISRSIRSPWECLSAVGVPSAISSPRR